MRLFDIEYKYFIKKVADTEKIYIILDEANNYILSEIENNTLIPVWSNSEFALLCKTNGWENAIIKEITLEWFENNLIDYIENNNLLINVFPVYNKTGFVVDINELARDLNDELKNYS